MAKKTKSICITLSDEAKKEALRLSKSVLGKENISGIINYLINKEINQKPDTK